ncbi:hypothetical protein KAU45_05890 [bacterium]|nr:hypothetical protein [bacterium]
MRKLSLVILGVALFVLFGCFDEAEGQGPGFSPPEGSYEDGYNEGFREGYQMGYSDGFTAGGGSSGGGGEVEFDPEEFDVPEEATILGPEPDVIVQQFVDYFKAENEAQAKALFAKDSPQLKSWDSDWDQMQSANFKNWRSPKLHDHDSKQARVTVKCSVSSFFGSSDVRVFVDLVTREGYWMIYELEYSSW